MRPMEFLNAQSDMWCSLVARYLVNHPEVSWYEDLVITPVT